MNRSPTQPIIIGNWKMNKTIDEALHFVKGLLPLVQDAPSRLCLAVPFTSIRPIADLCKGTTTHVGGQNMHDVEAGAFTGEIAGRMLREAGAYFVLLGHSERRRFFAESNELINKKLKRALKDGLIPVLCIGETALEREQGNTENVLATQLSLGLEGLNADQAKNVVVAYEPVWAIGTSLVASPETAEEAHKYCRHYLGQLFNQEIAAGIPIIYGGSANDANAQALLEQQDVDGLLVGTASLDCQTFSKILHCSASKTLNT